MLFGSGSQAESPSRRAAWHTSRLVLVAGAATSAVLPVAAALATQLHSVEPGDTLSQIANTYGVSVSELAAHNRLADPNFILAGSTLEIPDGSGLGGGGTSGAVSTRSYTVSAGDTLAGIALAHGVSVYVIATANAIANVNLILVGQNLVIPPADSPPALSRDAVEDMLLGVEAEFGLPSGLLQAIAWQESGWQQHVVSSAGAIGIAQLMPTTALWALDFLIDDDPDWETSALGNARVGASVLRHYLNLSGGDLPTSIAAYYQGWQAVQEIGWYDETYGYVANVLALMEHFQ